MVSITLRIASQIDDDIAVRLRAANENVPVGRLVEWLRSIGDRSRHQTALTAVTNTRPARPADGHVARLGQLQNALVGRLPMRGDAAACERDQRTGAAVVRGRMRSSRRRADDTRGPRLAAVEDFDVNPLRRNAQRCERLLHLCHEANRPAEVDIGLSWHADLVEDRLRQVTYGVEILTHLVARARPAVTNIATAVREREHEMADLGDEWMMLPVASSVQPQDLPCREGLCKRIQHRQNRRSSDSRAEQHERPLSGLQNEASAR